MPIKSTRCPVALATAHCPDCQAAGSEFCGQFGQYVRRIAKHLRQLIGGRYRLLVATIGCVTALCVLSANGLAFGQMLEESDDLLPQVPASRSLNLPDAPLASDELSRPTGLEFDQSPWFDSIPHASECPDCTQPQGRIPLRPYWDHGFWVVSDDQDFNLHVGGNVQWDTVWLNGSDSVLGAPSGNATSTTNSGASLPRRARLRAEGTIYKVFDYSVEFDLANATNDNKGLQSPTQDNLAGSPIPRNVWLQRRDVPFFGNVRVGNQVKPIGMDKNTSQRFLPFMERSDNMDGFYGPFDGGYEPGISANHWTESERFTWRYGLFRPLKNAFGVGLDGYTVSGRLTSLPVYQDNGASLLHLGLSGSQGSLVNDEFRLRARPLLRNGPGYAIPVIADTGTLPGGSQFLLGPELAAVLGPLTFQSEWTGQFISDAQLTNGQLLGTAFFHGGYVQVLYFLTGEHEVYEKTEGAFGRVIPKQSLRLGQGPVLGGAWQVGARISYLDLTDQAIDGGQIVDMTIGLNWFLNPNMKIQGNYLLADRQGQQGQGDGWFNGIGVRFACDF